MGLSFGPISPSSLWGEQPRDSQRRVNCRIHPCTSRTQVQTTFTLVSGVKVLLNLGQDAQIFLGLKGTSKTRVDTVFGQVLMTRKHFDSEMFCFAPAVQSGPEEELILLWGQDPPGGSTH